MTKHFVPKGKPSLTVTGHAGATVIGADGERYTDFTSGWCVANLGWNNPALTTQLTPFEGPDYVSPHHDYGPWEDYADLLTDVAPGQLTRAFRATGGSEAVDLALQAARLHTGRKRVLSLAGSYHGNTLAALDAAKGPIKPPLDARALDRIEQRLEKETVAAFLFEPIAINLGIVIPDKAFITGLQRLCRETGTLIIADEVACGFGRTGALFASEHFGLRPDLMCLAKSATNGMAPIGALLATPAVAKTLHDEGSYYSTYGWHPRSVHAAMVTLRHLISHGKSLYENAEAVSAYCCDRLHRAAWRGKATIRVRGPAIAVDLGDKDYASQVKQRCEKKRLLVANEGGALMLLPPLNVERALVEEALDTLESCIR
jgi:4-aminobutyrate aminotransferase-like enzyme